jgi:hypothetical protein
MIGAGPGLAYFVRPPAAPTTESGTPTGLLLSLTRTAPPSGTPLGLLLSLTLARPSTPIGLLLTLTKEA